MKDCYKALSALAVLSSAAIAPAALGQPYVLGGGDGQYFTGSAQPHPARKAPAKPVDPTKNIVAGNSSSASNDDGGPGCGCLYFSTAHRDSDKDATKPSVQKLVPAGSSAAATVKEPAANKHPVAHHPAEKVVQVEKASSKTSRHVDDSPTTPHRERHVAHHAAHVSHEHHLARHDSADESSLEVTRSNYQNLSGTIPPTEAEKLNHPKYNDDIPTTAENAPPEPWRYHPEPGNEPPVLEKNGGATTPKDMTLTEFFAGRVVVNITNQSIRQTLVQIIPHGWTVQMALPSDLLDSNYVQRLTAERPRGEVLATIENKLDIRIEPFPLQHLIVVSK